jgi:hypothetical protein
MRGGREFARKQVGAYEHKRTKARPGCEHLHGYAFLGARDSAGWRIVAAEIYPLTVSMEDHAS